MKNDPVYPISTGGAINIGLTKREYFAALAMQGLLARDYQNGMVTNRAMVPDIAAFEAVSYADALIIELEKET